MYLWNHWQNAIPGRHRTRQSHNLDGLECMLVSLMPQLPLLPDRSNRTAIDIYFYRPHHLGMGAYGHDPSGISAIQPVWLCSGRQDYWIQKTYCRIHNLLDPEKIRF